MNINVHPDVILATVGLAGLIAITIAAWAYGRVGADRVKTKTTKTETDTTETRNQWAESHAPETDALDGCYTGGEIQNAPSAHVLGYIHLMIGEDTRPNIQLETSGRGVSSLTITTDGEAGGRYDIVNGWETEWNGRAMTALYDVTLAPEMHGCVICFTLLLIDGCHRLAILTPILK